MRRNLLEEIGGCPIYLSVFTKVPEDRTRGPANKVKDDRLQRVLEAQLRPRHRPFVCTFFCLSCIR